MSIDEELVEFLKERIKSDSRMLRRLLLAQAQLRYGLSRGTPEAEEYRDCAMSEADWRLVKPVADMLFKGLWVPTRDYVLVRDALLDYAEEFARLLEYQIREWMVEAADADGGDE